MVEQILIDLKALLVEREDCDAGTVQQLRNGLAQGGAQYRTLRDVTQILEKRLETSSGAAAKKFHLKLGVAYFFLGYTAKAVDHLKEAEGTLANFYLGRALVSRGEYEEAFKAFDRAGKLGYTLSQVQLQKAGIARLRGDIAQARALLNDQKELASHSAEYHYQLGACYQAESNRLKAVEHFEKAVEFDPGHTGALFQLAQANDFAGDDEEAIRFYEACLKHPPVNVHTLMNLGILYEDHEKYDKASECYRRVLSAGLTDDRPEWQSVYDDLMARARLFYKDANASRTMYYNPEEESALSRFSQVLEIPVTDFELSVRSRNCLKKMNIRTLGDLTRVSEQQLLSSKNFGETSLIEIREMLASKGLRLGQSLEDGGSNVALGFRSAQPMSEQEAAVLGKQVSELNLSVRARKCMNRLGITTLGELVQRTADELLESKNFGMTSLNEVREKLAAMGLTLRGD
jgi:DNA-directed RNA polymerase subunit alpha